MLLPAVTSGLCVWDGVGRLPAVGCSLSPAPSAMASFDLDPSQQFAWELFLSGKNVGLFGRAGSGKSTLLGRAIARARRVHGVANVGVTAWTTTAAKMIGGSTFHKFLGIKVEDRPKEVILQKVAGNRFVRDKVRKTKVIFIDEVPQFSAKWFAVFEYVVRQLAPPYKHAMPWGGVQIVGTFEARFYRVSNSTRCHVMSPRGAGVSDCLPSC